MIVEVLDQRNAPLEVLAPPQRVVSVEVFQGFFFSGGGGGGGTIPHTTNMLKGDGSGNAADAGFAASAVVLKQPAYPTPTTANQIVACLQAAGLCALLMVLALVAPSARAINFGDIPFTTVEPSSVWQLPGGLTTQLQYNNAGVFAGVPVATYSSSKLNLIDSGILIVDFADPTKQLTWDVSTLSTGAVRTLRSPDSDSYTTSNTSLPANQFATNMINGVLGGAQPTIGNLAPIGTSTLVGTSPSSGNITQITLGSGLSMTGTVLSASGSGGTVTSITATAPIVVTPSPLTSTGVISVTGSALTKTDDTNVTLTLGGSPSTALLGGTSLTLGWTGQLGLSRGGTGIDSSTVTDGQLLIGQTTGHSFGLATLTAGSNVTITNAGHSITIAATGGGGGTPGGSNTQMQYNNSGAFGGVTNLTTDGTNVTALSFGSSVVEKWSTDTGLARNAAGVVEVNTGTAGTFGTLKDSVTNATTGFEVNGAATSGTLLQGNGTNYVASTPTWPTSASTTGFVATSDGTNIVMSPPTMGGSVTGHGDSNYTILSTDRIVVTNANLTAARTWTLPAASTVAAGVSIVVFDAQGTVTTSNTIDVVANGTDKILPGVLADFLLRSAYQGHTFTSNGSTRWYATPYAMGNVNSNAFLQSFQKGWGTSDYGLPTTVGNSGTLLQSNGTNVVFSTPTWPMSAAGTNYSLTSNGTNFATKAVYLSNGSSAQQTGFASDAYLTGSAITVTAGDFTVGTQYHCAFDMAKTNAGTATPIISIRVGTAGTTSDTAVQTITFGAGTANPATGSFDVYVNFRAVGSSATVASVGRYTGAAGIDSTVAATISNTTSSTFNSTSATKIGLSFNGGTSFSGTNNIVQADYHQP